MKSQKIDQNSLINELKSVKGSTFVSVLTSTDQSTKLIKPKSNEYFGIRKLSRSIGILNFIAQNSINRELDKVNAEAPDYKTQPTWFDHLTDCRSLVASKKDGSLYLFYKLEKTLHNCYVHNGKRISKEQLADKMRAEPQNYYTQTLGTEPIIFLTIKLENIKKISINKKRYTII